MSIAGKYSVTPVVKVTIRFLSLPPPSIPDSEYWLITNPSYSPSTARISRTSILNLVSRTLFITIREKNAALFDEMSTALVYLIGTTKNLDF